MPLDLSAVNLIATIARHGSFAAAARELGKVPSALTYSVRKFEDELDVLLFDRRGQRAVLTPAGRILLADGQNLLNEAQSLTRRVRQIGSGWEDELRIGIDAVVAFEAVAPLLADFDQLEAPTRIRLTYEVYHGTWLSLTRNKVDLAIGTTGAQPPVGLAPADQGREHGQGGRFFSSPLGTVQFVFCVAPGHPLSQWPANEPITDEALRRHRVVVVADSSDTQVNASVGIVDGQDCITVATLEQKIRAQASGLGIGYIPESFARPWLESGRLVERQVLTRRDPTDIFFAWSQPLPGKALAWWLDKLATKRVRQKLLMGPLN